MLSIVFRGLIALVSYHIAVSRSAVLKLDVDNFDKYVDGSTNVMVKFYAPWCGHCKSMAPDYNMVALTFQPEDDILIAEVDGTEESELSQLYLISGYPTILYFPKGSNNPIVYDNEKTADAMTSWINDRLGLKKKLPLPMSSVVDLDYSNFYDFAYDKHKGVVVLFYGPGCPGGGCNAMLHKMDLLANIFKADKQVAFGRLDGSTAPKIVREFGTQYYPVLAYFHKIDDEGFGGNKGAPEIHDGKPDLASLVKFINTQAGTARTPDGGLIETAGTIPAMEDLISKAHEIDDVLVEKMTALRNTMAEEGDNVDSADLYVSYSKKIAERGLKYIQHEIERLEKLSSKDSTVSLEKKTLLMLRANVLKSFAKNFHEPYSSLGL